MNTDERRELLAAYYRANAILTGNYRHLRRETQYVLNGMASVGRAAQAVDEAYEARETAWRTYLDSTGHRELRGPTDTTEQIDTVDGAL